MDRISTLSASGMASATELTVASLSNPTELNAIGLAVPDWRVCKTVSAGTDNAAWYRLDASSAAVDAPYIMASATAGLRWVAITGFSQGQPLNIKAPSISTAVSVLANTNNFSEVNVQNLNSGSSASSDFVVTADNGSASTHYVDLGINGSTGGVAPFITANGAYLYTTDNQLDISAQGASGLINLSAGPTPTIALTIAATVVTVPISTASTSTTTGALVVTGGVGVGGKLNVGGDVAFDKTGAGLTLAIRADDNKDANVSFLNRSGVGIIQYRPVSSTDLRWFTATAGIDIITLSNAAASAGALSVNYSTASTSTTTGALVVTGGVGVGGKLNVGGDVAFDKTGAALQFNVRADDAQQAEFKFANRTGQGLSIFRPAGSTNLEFYAQASSSVLTITNSALASGQISVLYTTDATTTTAGSLAVSGGVAVAKRLCLDGASGKTLKYVNGVANAAVAVLFGAIGPTGSTAGNAQGWIRIDVAGTDRYIPYW